MKHFISLTLILIATLMSCSVSHKQTELDELLISGDWVPLSIHLDSAAQLSNDYLIKRTFFAEGKISSVHACSLAAWKKEFGEGFLIKTSFINCHTDCLATFGKEGLYRHTNRKELVENGVVYLIVYKGAPYFYSSSSANVSKRFAEFDSIALESYLIRVD